MDKREELLRKIEESKLALLELENLEKENLRDIAIKNLDEYTPEEKIKFFDNMYNSALNELETTIKEGYHDEDCANYVWETYIQILSRDRKEFWKYWNSINR